MIHKNVEDLLEQFSKAADGVVEECLLECAAGNTTTEMLGRVEELRYQIHNLRY